MIKSIMMKAACETFDAFSDYFCFTSVDLAKFVLEKEKAFVWKLYI